jgi:hypothetical protein
MVPNSLISATQLISEFANSSCNILTAKTTFSTCSMRKQCNQEHVVLSDVFLRNTAVISILAPYMPFNSLQIPYNTYLSNIQKCPICICWRKNNDVYWGPSCVTLADKIAGRFKSSQSVGYSRKLPISFQNRIWDKRVAKNHTKTLDNLVIYRLNIIETDFILG